MIIVIKNYFTMLYNSNNKSIKLSINKGVYNYVGAGNQGMSGF